MLITILTLLDKLENLNTENAAVDVLFQREDGWTYLLNFAIPLYLMSVINDEKLNYYEYSSSFIIVNRLNKEIIEEAAKALIKKNDGSLVNVYNFIIFYGAFEDSIFDLLRVKLRKRRKKVIELNQFEEEILNEGTFKKDSNLLEKVLQKLFKLKKFHKLFFFRYPETISKRNFLGFLIALLYLQVQSDSNLREKKQLDQGLVE